MSGSPQGGAGLWETAGVLVGKRRKMGSHGAPPPLLPLHPLVGPGRGPLRGSGGGFPGVCLLRWPLPQGLVADVCVVPGEPGLCTGGSPWPAGW